MTLDLGYLGRMMVAIGLILSLTVNAQVLTNAAAPLKCQLKAFGGEVDVELSTTHKFTMIVTLKDKRFVCGLTPIEITKTNAATKTSEESVTGIAFGDEIECKPSLPFEIAKGLNKDLELLIKKNKLEFFIVDHEPAVACNVLRFDLKQTDLILESVKRRLPKPNP